VITQKNYPAGFRQRVEELAQERESYHRCFVNHEEVYREWVSAIVPKIDRVAFEPEESMDGRGVPRHARFYLIRALERFESCSDGFFQTCRCFAGWRG
jgi:hypothetical protein